MVAGWVIGESSSGELTGYWLAGIIAAISTAISIVLASRLRLAEESPEASAAVDTLEDLTELDDDGVANSAEPAKRAEVAGEAAV
jgi:hypothetical protein